MKPFNLEEYLANPSRKVVTRDGHHVRILCTDARRGCSIITLVEEDSGIDNVVTYLSDGTYLKGETHNYDLFFDTEKKEGWVNVYRNVRGAIFFSTTYSTKEEAIDELYDDTDTLIDTIKVEWEEGA